MKPSIFIAKSFKVATERLPVEIQKKVDTFFPKFQKNSKSPAIHYEPILNIRDNTFKSVKIDGKYRAILSHPRKGNNFIMLWVDTHDDAYAWAKNKVFEWNPNIDAWQYYEKRETLIEEPEKRRKIGLDFNNPYYTAQDLILLGAPESEVDEILQIISIDDLESRKNYMPEFVYEKLKSIFHGADKRALIEQVKEGKSTSQLPEEKMRSANNLQQFISLTDNEELLRFIRGELNHWQFFLHPEQTKLVKTQFKGPVKVTGGAGTGKTVAALHRFKHLVESGLTDGNKLLFCTYTNALAKNINALVNKLNLMNRGCYDIMTLHKTAYKLAAEIPKLKNRIQTEPNPDEQHKIKVRNLKLWEEVLSNTRITPEFAEEEYRKVILYQQIETKEVYLNANREGREKKISSELKSLFWNKLVAYRAEKEKRYLLDSDELFYELSQHYKLSNQKPYTHLILDELQDLSNIELRFLRYITKPGINDLFMVGDPFQQVYDRQINFAGLKISTTGRSKRLLVNYRTTEEIRRDAVKIIANEEFSDFEHSTEKMNGYISIAKGPEPTYMHFNSMTEEIDFVEKKIKELMDSEIYDYRDICIAGQRKETVQQFHSHFHKQGQKIMMIEKNSEISVPGYLNTSTFHSLKGLEFKIIFLVGLNNQSFLKPKANISDQERCEAEKREKALLYVAMTRAKMQLFLSGNGTQSPLLQKTYLFQM
jgi:superfamily I DNA/RNA helicase